MILKKHTNNEGQNVLAICDNDILGKRIEEGKKILDLCSGFYSGEETEDIEKPIYDAYIINAVGIKATGLLLKMGLVSEENIKRISNVPYAMVVNNKNKKD